MTFAFWGVWGVGTFRFPVRTFLLPHDLSVGPFFVSPKISRRISRLTRDRNLQFRNAISTVFLKFSPVGFIPSSRGVLCTKFSKDITPKCGEICPLSGWRRMHKIPSRLWLSWFFRPRNLLGGQFGPEKKLFGPPPNSPIHCRHPPGPLGPSHPGTTPPSWGFHLEEARLLKFHFSKRC